MTVDPVAREAWKSSFRSLGNGLVLNRHGGFSECPTRYPRGNQRPVVCELEVKHRKARVVERKFKWNLRRVEKDPMLMLDSEPFN